MRQDLHTPLRALDEELLAWAKAGAVPQLWWRDDDAYEESEALALLRNLLSEESLVLAVVPGLLKGTLVRALSECPRVAIVQHGWKHLNHMRSGAPPSEYPAGRGRAAIRNELSAGQRVLSEAFNSSYHRVFVPPWHRCATWILENVRALGFDGVSGQAPPFPLLRYGYAGEANVEIDICDWKVGGRFVGADRFAAQLLKALRLRRNWSAARVPIGVLSHHARITPTDFCILQEFVAMLRGHSVQWACPAALFRTHTATAAPS